jgi:hydroxymethylglutaryl-CoA lyase
MEEAVVEVEVVEVGLRDGLQNLNVVMATADKCRWIASEHAAGVREIEVGSFVPPTVLPQMADAADVVAFARTLPGLTVAALAPNLRGARDAIRAGVHKIGIPVSVSAAHSLANVRKTPTQMIAELASICRIRADVAPSVKVEAGLATAFGCTLQGAVPEDDVVRLAQACVAAGADCIALADTVGYANPTQVGRVFARVRAEIGDKLEAAHFHDTRGLGLANVMAALGADIRCFDASLAGLGGCPFAPGASGNIATEDVVFMLESSGFRTGIDVAALIGIRRLLEAALPGERLHGMLARAGLPKTFRQAA